MATAFVLAGIIRDPSILKNEKYPLATEDFPSNFHRILYTAIAQLVLEENADTLSPMLIEQYLTAHPAQYEEYNRHGGGSYLQSILRSMEGNFDTEFVRFKKAALLSRLHEQGMDVSPFFDPHATSLKESEEIQTRLESSSMDDILRFYESKLYDLRTVAVPPDDHQGVQAADGMTALKEMLKKTPEMGAPMNSKKLATICRGRRLTKLYLRVSPAGTGKAIPNYTKIPTYDSGWKRVDEIKVGDLLIDAEGKPTKVLAVYPQPELKEVYEIRFSDGRMAECCKDHLWKVRSLLSYQWEVIPTSDIIKRINEFMVIPNAQQYSPNCDFIGITSITPTGRYEQMTCFTVDNPDGLFLINDYIVTHNTRLSLSDACLVSIPKRYDPAMQKWVKTLCKEPTLFITTELEKDEVQTLIMAYVAAVPEDHILDGKYQPGEEKRVDKAISIIEEAPLWIEHYPQFNIDDIENLITDYHNRLGIRYVFFDYIFTSTKILMEIAQKTRGINLREDNVLMLFSDRMKALCNQLGIHIDTSTQANGDWKNAKDPDQNLIRGSKAIADKVDIGYVVLEPTPQDLEAVSTIIGTAKGMFETPNLVYHIFKVRRGKINHVKLFVKFDYATLRTTDLFVTDRNYKLLDVENTDIETILDETVDAPATLATKKKESVTTLTPVEKLSPDFIF